MRINVSPFRFVLCALALSVWSAPAFCQRVERGFEAEAGQSNTTESNAAEHSDVKAHHESAVNDWTHDRMLYPRLGPMDRLIALQKDPRAIQHWEESYRKDYVRWRGREGHRGLHRSRSYMHTDWNVFIGGSMDNATYPAKWTFDSNETVTGPFDAGSCLNDYLAVPIDATSAGGAGIGQPNIIGLNNLYSGTGPNGVCDRNGGVGTTTDDGVSATQYFSYTVIGAGLDGTVASSPVTSMDGNFIAFVEVGTGPGATVVGARFHVLAWKAHDGQNDSVSRQDALTNAIQIPAAVPFATAQLVAGSGKATDLALGTTTDSFSSPYVDYTDDVAYVGDDGGNIYKIKNVFCPAWAPSCSGNAPSLDGSFGSGGVLTIGGTCVAPNGFVSGITVDGSDGNIYAGCSDGKLYAFTSTGGVVSGSPLAIGDGNASNGGIIDPPILDVVNRWVYAETGSCVSGLTGCVTSGVGTGIPVLVQAKLSNLATNSVATLIVPGDAIGSAFNIHAPAFDDAYFTSATAASWILYEYAGDIAPPNPPGTPELVLYGITFGAGHAMVGGTPANFLQIPAVGDVEVSPITEFLTPGGEDRFFASNLTATNDLVSFNITGGFPGSSTPEAASTQGTGTSGIVADNTSSAVGQANSIYFGPLGTTGTNANTIVKVTQAGLL